MTNIPEYQLIIKGKTTFSLSLKSLFFKFPSLFISFWNSSNKKLPYRFTLTSSRGVIWSSYFFMMRLNMLNDKVRIQHLCIHKISKNFVDQLFSMCEFMSNYKVQASTICQKVTVELLVWPLLNWNCHEGVYSPQLDNNISNPNREHSVIAISLRKKSNKYKYRRRKEWNYLRP
eukprot:403375140